MHRFICSLPLILLGLALAGCPEDLSEMDEPDVVDTSVTDAVDGATTPTVTPYTGDDAARMTINSKPWGVIYLDGELLGNTPRREYAIAPGTHAMRLECGACPDPQALEWTFTVAAGELYTHIRTEFGDELAEPDVTAETEAEEGDGADLSGGMVQPYEGDDAAFMTINSKPWSQAYLDGQFLGYTPKKRFAIAPGAHQVKLECGKCATPQIREFEFNVAPGETYTEVRVEYTP